MARRKSQAPAAPASPIDDSRGTTPVDGTDASTPLDDGSAPATPLPTASTLKRKRGRQPRGFTDEASTPFRDEDGNGSDTSQAAVVSTPSVTTSVRGKRRGRPPATARSARNRGGPSHYTAVPLDKDGNPQTVENDEIVLPEDPAGEQKVDKNGYLKGGREYRCRTFTLLGRGDRLYMLSTEPARCIGFRDSYLFFQKHKQLYKIIVDEDEKYDMIHRDLIPHSYKGRAIGVVTARSVFREFGARMIVGGRRVTDDYFEQAARDSGAVEGEIAEPGDKLPPPGEEYNRNQYVAWHGASSVYHTGQPSVPSAAAAQAQRKKKIVVTETNWMLEHARAASAFNTRLFLHRQPCNNGIYEPHTNLMFYPAATQPTAVIWENLPGKRGRTVVTERLQTAPFVGRGLGAGIPSDFLTGYGDWDDAAIDALETEEQKQAVREQVQREKEWRAKGFL
ncbi:hypothetical protein EX30DRAFT_362215 [Ascodesmis nigricans]|uniref:Nuclear localization protein n=1 Tax=Ascodesmis nigricans TaxID=341454 RepID=A0A4S2N4W2_9PEZI|nr:hypothetical protein EX30DRAFT_362215 [Ascodesmis nigricans]